MKSFALSTRLPLLLLALAAAPGLAAGPSYQAQVDQEVQGLRRDVAARGWHFRVDANPAMEHSLDHLCGFKPELRPAEALAHEPGGYANLDEPDLQESLPSSYTGVFSRVKNQGQCGSCWAFATIGAVEAAYLKAHGAPNGLVTSSGHIVVSSWYPSLSTQQLVSCNPWGYGCNGGYFAFDMVQPGQGSGKGYYPGAVAAAEFPYVAQAAACVYVDKYFQAYSGGVFENTDGRSSCNHAIMLVGGDDDAGAWVDQQ